MQYQVSQQALKDKVILVTGAGDGIGKAAAIAYAQLGAEVILLGKTVAKLEDTYDQIVKQGSVEPAIIPLDMAGATLKNYQDMAQTIIDQFGRLDGLLLNASILGTLMPIEQYPEDTWNDVINVNVNAQFKLTQSMIPALRAAKSASVIMTSSSVGKQGRAFWGAYSVSKFATEGLMQVLASEFENTAIRFNCINPGATATNMRRKAFPAEDQSNLKTPEQIIPLYNYLMSDESTERGQSLDAQPK